MECGDINPREFVLNLLFAISVKVAIVLSPQLTFILFPHVKRLRDTEELEFGREKSTKHDEKCAQ